MTFCIEDLCRRHPELQATTPAINATVQKIVACFHSDRKLLICGNGGSAADADHIAGELLKSFKLPRPLPEELVQKLKAVDPQLGAELADGLQQGLPVINLCTHTALHTAFANDKDYINVYAQLVVALGKPGDILLGISTSGNSPNILRAFTAARAMGIATIALTGGRHGRMERVSDIAICVPETETDRIQELHLPVYHALCEYIEKSIFSK
ncbi:MAG: SIS domain-containing protein [Oscillospiraceae bacterium]